MTRASTKNIEKRQITKFISNSKHGLNFIGIEEGETPDFIVKTIDKKIGIEHTRYIDGNYKKVEQFRNQVINAAREKFETEVGVDIEVSFRYSQKPMDKEHNKEYYVNLLYKMVLDVYEVNKDREFTVRTLRRKVENKYIDSFTVKSKTTWSNWQSIGAFLVKPAEYIQVQKYIDRKSELISQYETELDEKWLVIIAGIGYRSSGYRFDLLDNSTITPKEFDRVFFFDDRAEEIIELSNS